MTTVKPKRRNSCVYYSEESCMGCEDWANGNVSGGYAHSHHYCLKGDTATEVCSGCYHFCKDYIEK